ncbi:PAQR family membrane homeostasis protein TrhA [Asticcacaulis sp. 201]|uniref:PAQR family membrane homeostasis protein TrhA n=1 Tax=Asticcacaulis sp. 201 TaxID=3028787 RepID=UPI002916B956|nr:hemolysin III family protein [Asticcacaulis sp. 201]MDV6330851.1 hemolysin III family protein [Asticcacaulis sp. 201]
MTVLPSRPGSPVVPTPIRADWIAGPEPHYPTASARNADLVIHILAITLALVGGGVAIGLAVSHGVVGRVAAVSIYAMGLLAMLSFSAAYNFAHARWQPYLYRVDHAGIFLMIAASYTPFTTQLLHGVWSIAMTAVVWSLATAGVLARLFLPRIGDLAITGFYMVLGWVILVAIKPLVHATPLPALILLATGGVLYTLGAVLFMLKHHKFRRAIWHGHVLAGAAAHYAAIMIGVVSVAG